MSSTEPGFWNFNLNRAARGHCTDVLNNETYFRKGGGHNDANGTSYSTRNGKFSTWNGEIYMNAAPGSGLYRSFSSVATWICDDYDDAVTLGTTLPTLGHCSVDDPGYAARRNSIMTSFSQFGCGVDGIGHPLHDQYDSCTITCISLNERTSRYGDNHIASASHVGDPKTEGNYMYFATIYTTGITVESVEVHEIYDGKDNTITLEYLHSGSGGAIYGSSSYPALSGCRSYYTELKYGNTTERYPTTGYFHTYGMSCALDWKIDTVDCSYGECCNTSTGRFKESTTICREKQGDCDIEEYCTGLSADCPDDEYVESGTVCREKQGDCDIEEYCTGLSADCPDDEYAPSSTICHIDGDICSSFGHCSQNSSVCSASVNSTNDALKERSNECVEYHCDKNNEVQANVKCSNNAVCISGKCVESETIEKHWAVDIDLKVNISESILIDPYEVKVELSEISEVDANDIIVAIKYDEDGNVSRIVLYVNDEKTAKTIVERLEPIDKSEECDSIFCRSEQVHTREITSSLSLANAHNCHHDSIHQTMMVLFTLLSFILTLS